MNMPFWDGVFLVSGQGIRYNPLRPFLGRTHADRPNLEEAKCLEIVLMEEILHQLIGSLSHYLQGFIHPRWCRTSSINSRM